ncbi:conserved hypothetical protein [Culex quinquefasciatus]|uniref:Potassium channel domain-containing protein n=1 Tax=Culex quinquefasciatus TaxID=7176 RepID=B0WXI3_CULQU|nr:conserved hypothetical protein [Culex quinquefasciatus]|eukprot:XP_001862105.1 conserved hypothetical protein [Culex quinquefasciatus]
MPLKIAIKYTAARASSAKQSVTINLNFWCNFSLNFLSSCTFFITVLFGVSSTTASVLARGINQSELGDNGFDTATITTSNVEDDIEDEITAETQTVTVPITICIMIMIGYIFFGARLFADWENWDILDGSYFCFISLSSIGFGDIVPGASKICYKIV